MEIFNVVQRQVFRDLKEPDLLNPTSPESEFYCNVGERILVKDTIDYGWYYKTQPPTGQGEGGQKMVLSDYGQLIDIFPPFNSYSANTIRVEGVDWLSEGIRIGDSYWAYWDGVPFGEDYGTIQGINGDTLIVKRDFATGNQSEHANFRICCNTNLFCADFSQNWQTLDNETSVNKLTNETNISRAVGFNDEDEITAVFNNENKANRNTTIQIKRFADDVPYPVSGFAHSLRRYTVKYFLFTPFWLENNELDSIFKGDGTMRFNTKIDFRRRDTLSADSVRTLNFVPTKSSLGYYNQNGKNGTKFIESCRILESTPSYEYDVLNKKKVLFRIKTTYPAGGGAISTGDPFAVTIFNKKDALDYRFNSTSLEFANWFAYNKSSVLQNQNPAIGFVKNIQSTINGEDGKLCLDVQVEIDYEIGDLPERWREGDEVRVIFALQGVNVYNSIYCDVPLIKNTDEFGLIYKSEFKIYDQFSNLLTDDQNAIKANIQDTVYVKTEIVCTPSYTGTRGKYTLNSLTGRLIAYRMIGAKVDWFELTSINIEKGELTRIISTDTFNNTYLSDYQLDKDTVDAISISTKSFYSYTVYYVSFPLKITWQNWVQIEANEVFYNENLDFNGFNQNAMTYFNKFGFSIHACLDVEVLNNDTGIKTIYRQKSGALDLMDINVGFGVTPIELKTFDSNSNDLNQKLLDGEVCTVKGYFDNVEQIENCDIIFSYESPEQAGFALIENSTNGYLQGLWQSKPIIEVLTPTNIVVSATMLGDGNAYNLSCKIQEKPVAVNEYTNEYTNEYN